MIRRPNIKDLNPLNDFFELVLKDTYKEEGLVDMEDEITKEIQSKMNYILKDLNSVGKEHYFLILEEDDQIVATAAYGQSGELIYQYVDHLKDVLELGSVFVHPDYQKKGYGNKIVDAVIEKISERTNEFCLDSGYTTAKQVWIKKFGPPFKILKDFWGNGCDHYIWHINL